MKSLLIVCNSLNTGGAEKQSVALANLLYRKGVDVYFVYLNPSNALLSEFDAGLINQVKCIHRKSYFDLSVIQSLRKLIQDRSIENMLCINQNPILYGSVLKFLIPSLRFYPGFHSTKLTLKESIKFYSSSWFLFKLATKSIYVCDNQKDYWAKRLLHLPGKAITIHNGINTDRFSVADKRLGEDLRKRLGIPESALVFSSIALLRPEKNHKDMVRAIARAVKSGFDCHLLCVGDGEERQNIERIVSELDLVGRVHLVGVVNDVRPYIAASNAVLLFSKSETFSMAVLEALASGCFVISYDVGGVKEQLVNEKLGIVIDGGDDKGFLSSVKFILSQSVDNSEYRHHFIEENFSDEIMADKYLSIL